ncbi:MAG: DUF2231 domain-containing protein [Gemmatimonadales bacterium]
MNGAHWHLLVNHVAVLGSCFGLLLFGIGAARGDRSLWRAGLWLLVATATAALAAWLTGESAEGIIEDLIAGSGELIEPHEEAGKLAAWFTAALGVFGVAVLRYTRLRERLPRALAVAGLVFALAAAGLLSRTAWLGGQINHPEIRPAGPAAAAEPRERD